MEEILTIIKAIEPVGIGILIWRTIRADQERSELMAQMRETQNWIEGLVAELMTRTRV